jgi:hypothetical protein
VAGHAQRERWEHEAACLALRRTLLQGRVLRSGDPAGIEQETWALLAVYQALRTTVTDAVQSVPGTGPDRASYEIAVETAQNLLVTAANITDPAGDLTGDIGRAVLARLHGPAVPASAPAKSSPRSAAAASTPKASPAQASASPASTRTSMPDTTSPRHADGNP